MLTGPKYHCSNVITGRDRREGRGGGRGEGRGEGRCTVYDMASWNVCSSVDTFSDRLKTQQGRDDSRLVARRQKRLTWFWFLKKKLCFKKPRGAALTPQRQSFKVRVTFQKQTKQKQKVELRSYEHIKGSRFGTNDALAGGCR